MCPADGAREPQFRDWPDSPRDAWGGGIERLAPTGQVVLLSAPGYLEDQRVLRTFRTELESRRIASSLIQTPRGTRLDAGGVLHAGRLAPGRLRGCAFLSTRVAVCAPGRHWMAGASHQ
jgi:hypothetical protein